MADATYTDLYGDNAQLEPTITNGLGLDSLGLKPLGLDQPSSLPKDTTNAQPVPQTTLGTGVAGLPKNAQGGSIIDIAKGYIGVNRYVYGKWDCSDFTQKVAAQVGAKIGGDTASQMDYFRRSGLFSTDMRTARPGDVLYFGSKGSPSGRHTGIYIGNGMMIDNAGRGIPIGKRSISGRTLLGIGHLTSLVRPSGDPKKGIATPADYGIEGATGRIDQKGSAPYGLQPDFWASLGSANAQLRSEGLGTVGVTSGYRSFGEQKALYDKQPEQTAPAGHSVHGLGLAADLSGTPRQLARLAQIAKEHGLVNYAQEPWHYAAATEKG